MIILKIEIELTKVPGEANEFGVGVHVYSEAPITPGALPEGEGATLIGIGMAINEYMRSRGCQKFNCLKGLVNV